MTQKNSAFDPDAARQAVERFAENDLTPAEALVASAELFQQALNRFREDASAFRAAAGEEAARAFAHQEFNDLIYTLQDAIQPALRTYNALLRDPDQKMDSLG